MDWGFIVALAVWFMSVGFLGGVAFLALMEKLIERDKVKQQAVREAERIILERL